VKNTAFILHLCLLLSLLPAQMATAQTQTDDGGNNTAPAGIDNEEEEASQVKAEEPAKAEKDADLFAFLDAPQRTLSKGLAGMARYMDEFFAEERTYYDRTGSYVRLTLDAVQTEGTGTSYKADTRIKLKLPRAEKKLSLTFESDPDERRDALDRTLEDSPRAAAQERTYYGGIEATLGDEEEWQFKPGIGFKFSKPIDIYLRYRIFRSYKWNDWLFRPSQTFYTFKESGFGSDTKFDLDYQLADNLLFRSSSFVRYTDENDYYEPSQEFSLYYKLSAHRGIIFQTGVYGITEPTLHATNYLFQMRYRQLVHSNYLYVELIPRSQNRKETGFDSEHSLTFRIEVVFEG
jgi:hypothetical protein